MLSLEHFTLEVHFKFYYGPGLFIISVEDKKTICAVSLAISSTPPYNAHQLV
jgi:hypothetical protein